MRGGDGSDTGSVTKEGTQTSTTGISTSLTPDFRVKEKSNNFPWHWCQGRCNGIW